MPLFHETDNAILLLNEALRQGLLTNSHLVLPPDEIQYRSIYCSSHRAHTPNTIEYGILEAHAGPHPSKTKTHRKMAVVAGLPTIADHHLMHLTSDERRDVICGFLGPFDYTHSSHQLYNALRQASRRETTVQHARYADEDFALAISYKHRNRQQVGATLEDSDARILADALLNIIKSIQGKKLWVWFDQQLAKTVPQMDQSKWYRFGAVPYLVLPVLRYVNSSMLGKKERPWLLFEECAAQTGCGLWSVGNGMLPQQLTKCESIYYLKGKYDKHVLFPGHILRWRCALRLVLKNFWCFRWDTFLEGYEYKKSYQEFLSWATLLATMQFVPDKTMLPWFYRLEKSFSSLLDASEQKTLTDTEAWSDAHLKLRDFVRNKAEKALLPDGCDGDSLRPTVTESGFIALRLFDGTAISQENEKLKVVLPCKASPLQMMASSGTNRYRIVKAWPNAVRVYYPATGELQLFLVRMPDEVHMLTLELAGLITTYEDSIHSRALQTDDWPCYVSYLAFRDMDSSLWDNPIYYMWRGQARLLQVELVRRNITMFTPDVKFQAMIAWKYNSRFIHFVRRCPYVQVCRGYTASHHSVHHTVYEKKKIEKPLSVTGAFFDADSDAVKALLPKSDLTP